MVVSVIKPKEKDFVLSLSIFLTRVFVFKQKNKIKHRHAQFVKPIQCIGVMTFISGAGPIQSIY